MGVGEWDPGWSGVLGLRHWGIQMAAGVIWGPEDRYPGWIRRIPGPNHKQPLRSWPGCGPGIKHYMYDVIKVIYKRDAYCIL